METARSAGTLRSLRLEAVRPSVVRGRERGGSTDDSADLTAGRHKPGDAELLKALRELNRRLCEPITAEVSMLGRKGLVKSFEKYDRQTKRGAL